MDEHTPKKPKVGSLSFGLLIVLCLLLGAYSSFLGTSPTTVIRSASSGSVVLRKQGEYQAQAEAILSQSLLSRSKITIDTLGFESKMKQHFPELERASLELPLYGIRPKLTLVVKQPVIRLVTTGGVFLLDKTGQVMVRVSDVENASNIKLIEVNDESGAVLMPGTGGLTASQVDFVLSLVAQLSAAKLDIESITLTGAAGELHMKPRSKNFFVKFDTQNDPRLAAGECLAFIKKADDGKLTVSEYVDVRLEDKVYYK